MNRRSLLGLSLAAMLGPRSAGAQSSPRAMRVVIQGGAIGDRKAVAAWLAEEGFVDGRNVVLEFTDLDSASELERKAAAVVASRPDAILVPGGDTIALFKRLTREIPIVFFSLGGDPVRMGLVESFRRPGANLTGTTNQASELMVKGWELLTELRPGARRIGALFDRGYLANSWMPLVRELQAQAATRLGLALVEIVVPEREGFAPVERAIGAAKIDLLDVSGGWEWPWRADLHRLLERRSIPALWEAPGLVRSGGLLSVMGSFDEARREAVRITAKILRGADPATLPVHEVKRVVITINARTARAMGLAIPPAVLLRADVVVDE